MFINRFIAGSLACVIAWGGGISASDEALSLLSSPINLHSSPSDESIPVYRVYSPFTGEHLLTTSSTERDVLAGRGWYDEGVAWYGPAFGIAVYRTYNPASGEHHYTADAAERTTLLNRGWNDEGIAFYASDGGTPVHRLYSASGGIASHHLTTSQAEADALVQAGWKLEGTPFFVVNAGVSKAWPEGAPAHIGCVPVYRLYNPESGEHLYTTVGNERTVLTRNGWYDEGTAWSSPSWSSRPVYRLYNPSLGDHHYTVDLREVSELTARHNWHDEGIAFYSSLGSEVAVYRQFNEGLKVGSHHYTTDSHEYEVNNERNGWNGEGIAWYAAAPGNPRNLPKYVVLNVPYTNQMSEGAPWGCEGASLYMALRYKGYIPKMSYRQFMDTMPISPNNNLYTGFVGSPWVSTGVDYQGMMWQPTAMWGATYGRARDLTPASNERIIRSLQEGNPVVVWTSVKFRPSQPVTHSYGTVLPNGHVMTLIGYNSATHEYLVADPAATPGKYWVSEQRFNAVWQVFRGAVEVY